MQRVDRFPRPLLAALLASITLAGCQDNLARRDFMTAHTGDAVAANKAIHIADPWRRESFNVNLPSDGSRAAAPIGRYRSGEGGGAAGAARSGGLTTSASPTQ